MAERWTWQEDWMTRWTMVWRKWIWNCDKRRGDVRLNDDVMMELEINNRTGDDQNPNVQSVFSLGYQWWLSKAICLTLAPTLNGNSDYHLFLFGHKTATLTLDQGYALCNVYASISQNILLHTLHLIHF